MNIPEKRHNQRPPQSPPPQSDGSATINYPTGLMGQVREPSMSVDLGVISGNTGEKIGRLLQARSSKVSPLDAKYFSRREAEQAIIDYFYPVMNSEKMDSPDQIEAKALRLKEIYLMISINPKYKNRDLIAIISELHDDELAFLQEEIDSLDFKADSNLIFLSKFLTREYVVGVDEGEDGNKISFRYYPIELSGGGGMAQFYKAKSIPWAVLSKDSRVEPELVSPWIRSIKEVAVRKMTYLSTIDFNAQRTHELEDRSYQLIAQRLKGNPNFILAKGHLVEEYTDTKGKFHQILIPGIFDLVVPKGFPSINFIENLESGLLSPTSLIRSLHEYLNRMEEMTEAEIIDFDRKIDNNLQTLGPNKEIRMQANDLGHCLALSDMRSVPPAESNDTYFRYLGIVAMPYSPNYMNGEPVSGLPNRMTGTRPIVNEIIAYAKMGGEGSGLAMKKLLERYYLMIFAQDLNMIITRQRELIEEKQDSVLPEVALNKLQRIIEMILDGEVTLSSLKQIFTVR